MNTALTPAAAKELGRSLRFLRHARDLTMHDIAVSSGLSVGYIQNIEGGARNNASEESFWKLAKGYKITEDVMRDFLLRARILSALERHGLAPEQQTFIWRGVESRLAESGRPLQTDLSELIRDVLGNGTK